MAESAREPAPPAIDLAPYRERLTALIEGLERAVTSGAQVPIVRLPIERLGELLEDLESIGATALAHGLAPIVDRLRRALGETDLDRALTAAIADLRALLDGAPPPARKSSRWAFWK
jgi:hypothetical protein